LLLLFVGLWDRSRIPKFKNTKIFTEDDFDLLMEILDGFGNVVTTTHILAEISNLSGQHGDPERSDLFRKLVSLIPLLPEYHLGADIAVVDPVFVRLGLTDAAIAAIASDRGLHVLTTDFDLWAHLQKIGVASYNFNHIRQAGLLP